MKRLWLLALAVMACRTDITPVLVKEPPAAKFKMVEGECEVYEYARGDEMPPGASNLGWVQVERADTDEATYARLRLAVCAKGGTAFSQARWLRNSGPGLATPPFALEANAWVLAEPK